MPFDPTSGLISIFIFLLLNLVILGLLITFSVFNIIGCVKYYQGTYYQAPLSIRFSNKLYSVLLQTFVIFKG